jgi:hypothetical protein
VSEVRQLRRSGTGDLRLAVGGFARLVLAAFALIVGDAVVALSQRGDYAHSRGDVTFAAKPVGLLS